MNLRVKLIALFLVIALVPVTIVGGTAVQNMGELSSYAQTESSTQLEKQVRGELNNSVEARREEIQNLINGREVEVSALGESRAVNNYFAASAGELELVQRLSEDQVGYTALQIQSTIETARQTILEQEYDGRDWAELSVAEQRAVERQVEERLAGTAGNGTTSAGTVSNQFQPGYIGDTGFVYITDRDSKVVVHHEIGDGTNLTDDPGLSVFEEVRETIETRDRIRRGEAWGVASYQWPDTSRPGNPVEQKFISYTYDETFDWIIAPSVYYYELQDTAVDDARFQISQSFQSYLQTRTITTGDREQQAYRRIVLTNSTGDAIVEVSQTEQGQIESTIGGASYTDADWYENTRFLSDGQVYFGDVRTVDGEQRMTIATPVYYDGNTRGVIAAEFDYSVISDVTNSVTVGESGYLSIVNAQGRVVSHPNGSIASQQLQLTEVQQSASLSTLVDEKLTAGETGMTTYSTGDANASGTTNFVAYAPLEFGDNTYSLVATVPEGDVTEPARILGQELGQRTTAMQDFFLLLSGLLVLGVAVAGFGAARYFSKPIRAVRDQAMALSRGEIDEQVDVDAGNDEIGELVEAFEAMHDYLTTVSAQADALADQDFDAAVLEEDVPGELGAALSTMHRNTEAFIADLDDAKAEAQQAQAEAEALASSLEDQAGDAAAVLEQAADGDLTVRMDTDSDTEAMRMIASEFNDMLAQLEETLLEIQSFSDEVVDTSESFSTSATEIKRTSEDVSTAIEEISTGTTRQSERLQNVSGEMNSLSATVQEIASSSTQVATLSQQAAERGERGQDLASESITRMDRIEAKTDETAGEIESLHEEMSRIVDIVDLIDDIAEQTNILALNASIEAANAEGSGEGFAVVADEVKQLAEETQEATREIEERVTTVQDRSEHAVDDIQEMQSLVQEGTNTIEEGLQALEDIVENVREADDGIQSINDATDEQADSTQEVVSMVDEVATISEQTNEEADRVSAAAEEQTATVTEVASNADDLADQSRELKSLVDRFDVSEAAWTERDPEMASDETEADGKLTTDEQSGTDGEAATESEKAETDGEPDGTSENGATTGKPTTDGEKTELDGETDGVSEPEAEDDSAETEDETAEMDDD